MTRIGALLLASLCFALPGARPAAAGKLDDIRAAGVVRIVVYDSNPPFGFVDTLSRKLVGYDIDFARALAAGLGVKLELLAANSAERMPLLQSGKADLVAAELTVSKERARGLAFSIPYFEVDQQLLVRMDGPDEVASYGGSRIGAVHGTSLENYLASDFPAAKISRFPDTAAAMAALRTGAVDAVIEDGPVLQAMLAQTSDRDRFKLLPATIWRERIAIGMPLGERDLLAAVNATLLTMERNGEAARIFHAWFDRFTPDVAERTFTLHVPCDALSGWTAGPCKAD